MKKKILLLASIIVCVSCSWDEETEYSKRMKVYYQTHSESNDSTSSYRNADSTFIINNSSSGRALNSSAISPDSFNCELQIEGNLIVDGGTSTDISDTYVTVEKIVVRAWIDGNDDIIVYQPKIDSKVAEPAEVLEWENMPECVNYRRKMLTVEPVTISYKDYFYAEVEVCYILRIRDTYLASTCSADRYWNTVRFGSSNHMNSLIIIFVPLELITIQFGATVEGTINP